jgi:hypothetical protein
MCSQAHHRIARRHQERRCGNRALKYTDRAFRPAIKTALDGHPFQGTKSISGSLRPQKQIRHTQTQSFEFSIHSDGEGSPLEGLEQSNHDPQITVTVVVKPLLTGTGDAGGGAI